MNLYWQSKIHIRLISVKHDMLNSNHNGTKKNIFEQKLILCFETEFILWKSSIPRSICLQSIHLGNLSKNLSWTFWDQMLNRFYQNLVYFVRHLPFRLKLNPITPILKLYVQIQLKKWIYEKNNPLTRDRYLRIWMRKKRYLISAYKQCSESHGTGEEKR